MFIDNFKISCIKHSEISEEMIDKIIEVKRNYWNYTYEEHNRWMKENIKDDEYHLIILNEELEIIAYLTMAKTYINYNDIREEVIGVGNVCVDKKYSGLGIGQLLMSICNYYLNSFGKRTILMCKEHLIKFYEKSGWTRYEGEVYLNNILFQGEIMFKEPLYNNKIALERNF